jgi:hypothetical protein
VISLSRTKMRHRGPADEFPSLNFRVMYQLLEHK